MQRWLRFFRIVNLPTVPGDVLVGAAAILGGSFAGSTAEVCVRGAAILAACLASIGLYLFGLADNDIVGAKTDGPDRPIPAGAISLRAARLARGLCLFAALIAGAAAGLPPLWWSAAVLLAVAIAVYNRSKWCLVMGLCRGLNVLCGGAALITQSWRGVPAEGWAALLGATFFWTVYIAAVTKYSEGESTDPLKKHAVGLLIGALIYLQLAALLVAYLFAPNNLLRNLMLIDAGLLVLLRVLKRTLPTVSAS